MSRPSLESKLTVVQATGQRLSAPKWLTLDQKAEWKSITGSLPADYFRPGDVSLLAAYCFASALYKKAAADMDARGMTMMDDKGREYVNPAHQVLVSQASAMAQMAVKLRLCPSARYSEKQASTKAGGSAKPARPWEDETGT